MKVKEIVYATLTPRVAPMIYIMMFVSIFVGFCFWTGFLIDPNESVLYNASVLIPFEQWGFLLFFTATTTEIGLYLKQWTLVSIGGIGGFMLWLMASIGLFMNTNFYALVSFGLFHLLFHGYVYLAAALGVLERAAIRA
jgi:hypothetical protein